MEQLCRQLKGPIRYASRAEMTSIDWWVESILHDSTALITPTTNKN